MALTSSPRARQRAAAAAPPEEERRELRLRQVTLYKNNLAFYEREAHFDRRVNGPHVFPLRVPKDRRGIAIDTLSLHGAGAGATIRYGDDEARSLGAGAAAHGLGSALAEAPPVGKFQASASS